MRMQKDAKANRVTQPSLTAKDSARAKGSIPSSDTAHAATIPSPAAGRSTVKPAARAPLSVRIAMAALAIVALAAAGFAMMNLATAARFNQATTSLSANIAAASKENADLSTLKASQQQVDEQFGHAGPADSLLLPGLRSALASNRQVSNALTARITEELNQQRGNGGTDAQNPDAGKTSGSEDTDKAQKGGALTDDQKRQVEELLKANQQSTPAPETTDTTKQKSADTKQSDTKPW